MIFTPTTKEQRAALVKPLETRHHHGGISAHENNIVLLCRQVDALEARLAAAKPEPKWDEWREAAKTAWFVSHEMWRKEFAPYDEPDGSSAQRAAEIIYDAFTPLREKLEKASNKDALSKWRDIAGNMTMERESWRQRALAAEAKLARIIEIAEGRDES